MNKNKQTVEDEKLLVFRKDRVLYFFDEIHANSVSEAIYLLDIIEAENKKDIIIQWCSEGGDCYFGLALYDRIRQSQCNIISQGKGLIASMALILFLAGDERTITENTRLLSHQVSQENFSGRSEDFKIESKEIEALNEILVSIIAGRTGQPESRIRKDQKIGDYWINAETAKDDGYIDTVLKNPRSYRKRKK